MPRHDLRYYYYSSGALQPADLPLGCSTMNLGKAALAEFIGTFFLCFAGIAAILSTYTASDDAGKLIAVALAHGLAVSIAVSVFGGVSGAHINPAVTTGMLVTGRIAPIKALFYILAQCAGATVAALACKAIFPPGIVHPDAANLGIPLPADWVGVPTLLMVEFILTFLLMISVFGTAIDERGKGVKIGGFAIGLTVTMDILAGGAVSGASMNPARSFGPALVQGYWALHIWYWVAPIAGAIAAALVYEFCILDNRKSDG
jgi:aquaporin Z